MTFVLTLPMHIIFAMLNVQVNGHSQLTSRTSQAMVINEVVAIIDKLLNVNFCIEVRDSECIK